MKASSSKRSSILHLLLPAMLCATGCVSHHHSVGLGPTGSGEVTARQYYMFFGLLQVNEVDAQRMAGDLTSYSIDTSYSLTDILLAPLIIPLTLTTRTVVVRT